MSPISRQVYQLGKLRTKILEIQTAIDGSIRDHSPTQFVLAMQAEIILIKIHLNEFFDMWADYLLLAGETNTHNNAAIRVVQSYIDSMYSVANNINHITTGTIDSVLDLLRNISAVINGRYDGYSDIVKSLTDLKQIVEARDNPPIPPIPPSSNSSSYSSSSSRSSRRSSRHSSRRSSRSSPFPSPLTSHYTPPSIPLQLPAPVPLPPTLPSQNRRVPPLLQRQNVEIFTLLPPSTLPNALGKKYRKIKTKKRKIKSTYRKPLTTNNSRKHRKIKQKRK